MTGRDLLAEAVEELYSADPEGFTERRAELVARARSAGQAAVARQIAALRKPNRSAWVINQLARSDPEAVSRLAGLGDELRAAERARDGGALRELSQTRRRMIAELVRQALAAAGQQTAPAALREDVTVTLAAALADPEVAEQIGHGMLLRPARRAGFGAEQGPVLALVPPPAPDRPEAAEAPRPAGTEPEPARAKRERERERERPGREQERWERERPGREETEERAEREWEEQQHAAREEREHAAREERERAAREERERAEREQEERERAEAERERQEARAEAERALADADQAVESGRAAEQELADRLRGLEQQVADLRRRMLDTRTEVRQAQIAQRRARQALGRLPQ